jgi:hypothetical protein
MTNLGRNEQRGGQSYKIVEKKRGRGKGREVG